MALSVEKKRSIAAQFKHWHYSYDLGDGVITSSFKPNVQRWHDARRTVILELVRKLYGDSLAGKICLDIACNSGFWSFALAELGPERVFAIDRSSGMIKQAEFVRKCYPDRKELKRIKFRCQDLFDLNERNAFDLVLCLGLFYHLTDPVSAAARIFEVARDVVVIDSTVSVSEEPILEIGDPQKYRGIAQGEFSFVPSVPALTRILQHAGFRSVERWHPGEDSATALKPYRTGTRAILIVRK